MAGPFETQVRQFAERTRGRIDATVQAVVLETWSRLVARSPVGTGHFQANWRYGFDAAPSGVVSGDTASPPRIPRAAGVHYLVNNLPYARQLEYGGSQRSPGGMVRLTVAEFGGIVKAAANGEAGGGD